MRANQTGKPRNWRTGRPPSTEPEVAAKIAAWWTPERREARRQEALARNPLARYHGLSAKAAKAIREAVGTCQDCGGTNNLDVHHLDGDKRNQALANLTVLCHQCHMRRHAAQN